MRIALVQDRLTERGDGENLLPVLMELFPDAQIFTLVYQPGGPGSPLENRRVTASLLQRLPFGKARPAFYLPLYWELMAGFDLSGYDLIVSFGSPFSKWLRNPKGALHVHFSQTLPEWLWAQWKRGESGKFPEWQTRFFQKYLQRCDLKSAQGVTHFLTGSEEMRDQIRRIYGREAEVLPPPLDAKFLFKLQVYFRRLFGIPIQEENLRL